MKKVNISTTTYTYNGNKALENMVNNITVQQMRKAFGEPTSEQGNHWQEWMFYVDGLCSHFGIAFNNGEPRIRMTIGNHDGIDLRLSVFLSLLSETIKKNK
jgi:hypothetical protein